MPTLIVGLDSFTSASPRPVQTKSLILSALGRLCLPFAKLSMCAAGWGDMHALFPVAVTRLPVWNVTLLPLRRRANWAAARATFRQMFATISRGLALAI